MSSIDAIDVRPPRKDRGDASRKDVPGRAPALRDPKTADLARRQSEDGHVLFVTTTSWGQSVRPNATNINKCNILSSPFIDLRTLWQSRSRAARDMTSQLCRCNEHTFSSSLHSTEPLPHPPRYPTDGAAGAPRRSRNPSYLLLRGARRVGFGQRGTGRELLFLFHAALCGHARATTPQPAGPLRWLHSMCCASVLPRMFAEVWLAIPFLCAAKHLAICVHQDAFVAPALQSSMPSS